MVQSPDDLSGFLMLGGQQFNLRGDGTFEMTDRVIEFDALNYTWVEREDLTVPKGARSWITSVPLPDDYVQC